MGGFGVVRSPAAPDMQERDQSHNFVIAIDGQLACNGSAIAFILYYT